MPNTTSTITPANLTLTTGNVSRPYDGTTQAAGTIGVASGGGTVFTGDTLSTSGSFAFTDKNAGTGDRTISVAGGSVTDGNSGKNYTLSYVPNTTSTITPRPVTLTALAVPSRVYDGTTTATLAGATATFNNLVTGESLGVGAASALYDDRNVGSQPISITGLSLTDGTRPAGVALASNYSLTNAASFNSTGEITIRPQSNWTGLGGTTLWSNPTNWDALPDGKNVAAVSIAAGSGPVVYDLSVPTIFNNLGSSTHLTIAANSNLTVNNTLSAGSYTQDGGTVTAGLLTAGGFDQRGGVLTAGTLSTGIFNQSAGTLNVGIAMVGGSATQASLGAINSTTSVTIPRGGDISLLGSNSFGSISAEGTSVNIRSASSLDVAGLSSTTGNIVVEAGGTVSVSGDVKAATGSVSIVGQGLEVRANVTGQGVTLNAGNDDLNIGSEARSVSVLSSGSMALLGSSVRLLGGISDGAFVRVIGAGNVDVTTTATGALIVSGGAGAGAYALLDPSNIGSVLTINAPTVNLTGGLGSGAYAAIVSQGDIVFNSNSLTLTPGAGQDADAVVVSYQGAVSRPPICNGCIDLLTLPLNDLVTQQGIYVTPAPAPAPAVDPNEIVRFTDRFDLLALPDAPIKRANGDGLSDIVVGDETCSR